MYNKNILLLYTNMNVGGAQRHIIDLAIGLKKNNYNVFIGSSGGKLVKEIQGHNIEHINVLRHSLNPLNILKSFNQIHKFIKQKNINIVHSHHRLTNFFVFIKNYKN